MGVQYTVGINVIKPLAVGVFVVNGNLVGIAPVVNILFCECVGLLEQLRGYLETLFAGSHACQCHDFGTRGSVEPVA